MVYRIFSEKKEQFRSYEKALQEEITHFLGVQGLDEVRIVLRYDVEGCSKEEIAQARSTIFSEPSVEDVYLEEFPHPAGFDYELIVEALPGQFDQTADSCAQCIQMLTGGARPRVNTARVYLFKGTLSDDDKNKIGRYLVNPVENRIASSKKPVSLEVALELPKPVETVVGFSEKTQDELATFLEEFGLAMDLADLQFLQAYFRDEEKRDPTVTEIRVIDTYWSDHCRHTTFGTHLTDVSIEHPQVQEGYNRYLQARKEVYGTHADERPITLMDIATLGAKVLKKRGELPELDVSEEINACSIHVDATVDGNQEDWLLMFKNETHNHPTEIEPFGGAATCIGGCIRDPLSGRAYVHQAMRVTGCADPRTPFDESMAHKLPQKQIAVGAANGYSSYGNQIGLATGLVSELYHPGYAAKHLECGAVVAAVPAKQVRREEPKAGDVVVLLGGRTGRDGIGGATGSSKSHNETSLTTMASEVQKGNAPEERKIQRLFRDSRVTRLIKRCNDFGAGGVSVAIGELADGLEIDLDAVRKKYEGMDGTELAISESQERMAVVLDKGDVSYFCELAANENLEAYPVATVSREPRMKMQWQGQCVADLSRAFLNSNGASREASVHVLKGEPPSSTSERPLDDVVSDLNAGSQKGLVERFDSTVGAGSLMMPFGGKTQRTPAQAMAALLPVLPGKTSKTASLMSFGCDLSLLERDPYAGAYASVTMALSKLVAGGADYKKAYLTLQEYFCKMTGDEDRWGVPFSALLGAFSAQLDFGVAAIGGKDSMSGTFMDLDVPPTVLAFAVAPFSADELITNEFKAAGNKVYRLIACSADEQKELWDFVHRLAQEKKIASASVVEAHMGVALFNSALGNNIGFTEASDLSSRAMCPGAILIETAEEIDEHFAELIGYTTDEPRIVFGSKSYRLEELYKSNARVLEDVYPTQPDEAGEAGQLLSHPAPLLAGQKTTSPMSNHAPAFHQAKPHVLIPVFPGTNCEYDSARACLEAGLEPEICVIKNLSPEALQESVNHVERALSRSQVLFLPGGFSGGDEPNGSAKFIVSFFRNPQLVDAVEALLHTRDGLALGICNGFQALIKLGLVPYGHIVEPSATAPTLTYNTIGRHQSKIVRIKVASTLSPWLLNTKVGELFSVPISHGEGRFVASQKELSRLAEAGQIATQYVDLEGMPTYASEWNPNGSLWAVEGITSPDGRVFGKMGHSERVGTYLYQNVEGTYDMELFSAAKAYFA